LSEGVCGDDPSTVEEIKKHGSDGHFSTHPDEIPITLAGDLRNSFEVPTLSERVEEDDPSVLEETNSASSSELSSESSL
jgi:hypothetical protein